jgi:two-component system, cell cycle sensor histidine kinase and response regulator CckA
VSRIRLALRRVLFEFRGGDRLNGSDDEYAVRSFHLALSLLLCWIAVMEFLVVPLFAMRKVAIASIATVLGGVTLGALVLLRRGRKRAAGVLFLGVLWCVLGIYSAFSGGIHTGGGYMVLVVIIAAWWLGLYSALGLAAATLLLTLAEALLEYSGHTLPVYFPGDPLALWAAQAGIVGLTVAGIVGFVELLRGHISDLRDNEERIRSLSDSSLEGIMIHDYGVILNSNLAFARIFGYEHPDELIGKNSLELLLTPESQARIRERWERDATGILELTGVRKDGATFPVETESRAMKYRNRDARLVACRDIAERKRAEEGLRENERRLKEAQQMAHVGSYTSDVLTGRQEWSEELCRIYELDPSQSAVSRDVVLARAHPDDRALIQKTTEDLIRQNGRFEFEHRLLLPDGRIKFVLVTGTVSPGADGRPRTRGTVQDITERKRAEQEREKLQAQLALAQKMESIGRLAGGVAHDFNNMLTVILGYAAMGKAALAPETKQHKYMTEIEKAANRSKEITKKLLGFSRQQIIAPIPSNLNDLVADLEEPLARLIGEDIELVFHPWEDLWKVVVDHSQINQILLNLVVNARDAMPRGGKLTIETQNANLNEEQCRQQPGALPGQHVLLAVSDTGVGMDPETLSHIFEPFFTTKDPEKGTGLGLATVYGVVQQNRGFVNVYSKPGHGTAFEIYFPKMQGEAETAEISVNPQAIPAGRGTILLMEDDELVRKVTKAILESIGYTPLVAASPQQAIELCSRSDIRLLLTDLVMPGMNGIELRERVRALNPGMKILFMSGYASNVIANHGVLKKGMHFIQKPFTIEDLGRRLEEVLASD